MEVKIDGALVQRLIAKQFPDLRHLPIRPIEKQGHDNRTFRLGSELAIRLPSQPAYADAVSKEAIVLAAFRGSLSVGIPEVYALGAPSEEYPMPWSIRHWLAGATLEDTQILDRTALASALGATLVELRSVPTDIDFIAGQHSFYRGCHPSVYGHEVVQSLKKIKDQTKTTQCMEIWQKGTATAWTNAPVWFHGDLAVGNVLVTNDNLSALIDFGTCGVGDPACDFAIAWTYFNASERAHFRAAVEIDDGTWHRAKAWALWKALVSLTGLSAPDTQGVQARALNEILGDEF